jgi:hypothetical protein
VQLLQKKVIVGVDESEGAEYYCEKEGYWDVEL